MTPFTHVHCEPPFLKEIFEARCWTAYGCDSAYTLLSSSCVPCLIPLTLFPILGEEWTESLGEGGVCSLFLIAPRTSPCAGYTLLGDVCLLPHYGTSLALTVVNTILGNRP